MVTSTWPLLYRAAVSAASTTLNTIWMARRFGPLPSYSNGVDTFLVIVAFRTLFDCISVALKDEPLMYAPRYNVYRASMSARYDQLIHGLYV
jgi:hypothetical protein